MNHLINQYMDGTYLDLPALLHVCLVSHQKAAEGRKFCCIVVDGLERLRKTRESRLESHVFCRPFHRTLLAVRTRQLDVLFLRADGCSPRRAAAFLDCAACQYILEALVCFGKPGFGR